MGKLFTELMRRLFGLLDNIVIFLIETLYNLIMMIADTNVLGDLIYHYLGRIYVFLGIFMVFKLSFSMITYIVNPDELTDKGKGFGKLISNVIISLILLVATPTLFNVAFDIQSDILKTNAIYQIVTGRRLSNDTAANNNEKMGKQIAYGIYSTFIYKEAVNDNYNVDLSEDISALTDSVTNGKCDNTSNPYCLVDMDTLLKKAESGSGFANKYWYLVSTICGGFVTYILLVFCFDTAVRSVKLGFLQIIAPIPILSMIDPKKGTEKVVKWGKECGKTFADLFIRLAGLFFVVDIIGVILGVNGDVKGMKIYTTGNPQTNLFVRLFVIIGLLMFAKQMPQLISDLLGIKLDGGGFSLKKKMGDIPGLGVAKALGAGALGFAGGMAANTLALGNKMWTGRKSVGGPGAFKSLTDGQRGLKGFGRVMGNVTSGLAGASSAALRGVTSKEKSLWKAAGAGIKGSVDKRNLRDQREATGYHIGRRTMAGVSTFAGLDALSHYDSQINQYSDIEKKASDILTRANGEMIKHNFGFNDSDGNSIDMNSFKSKKEELTLLRNQDTSTMTDAQIKAHAKLISDTQTYVSKTEKLAEQAFIDEVQAGRIADSQTIDMLSGLSTAIQNSTDDIVKVQSTSSGASIKAAKDNMGNAIKHVQNSDGYQRAQANKKQQ